MRYCRDCNVKMDEIISFSKEKNEKFYRCPKCYSKTKHQKIDVKELRFGEVLDKENIKENKYIGGVI